MLRAHNLAINEKKNDQVSIGQQQLESVSTQVVYSTLNVKLKFLMKSQPKQKLRNTSN